MLERRTSEEIAQHNAQLEAEADSWSLISPAEGPAEVLSSPGLLPVSISAHLSAGPPPTSSAPLQFCSFAFPLPPSFTFPSVPSPTHFSCAPPPLDAEVDRAFGRAPCAEAAVPAPLTPNARSHETYPRPFLGDDREMRGLLTSQQRNSMKTLREDDGEQWEMRKRRRRTLPTSDATTAVPVSWPPLACPSEDSESYGSPLRSAEGFSPPSLRRRTQLVVFRSSSVQRERGTRSTSSHRAPTSPSAPLSPPILLRSSPLSPAPPCASSVFSSP